MRLSNRFAYGYGHLTLYSPPRQTTGMLGGEAEEVAGLEVHTLPEPEGGYEGTLRRLMDVGRKREGRGEVDDDAGFAGGDEEEREGERRPAVALLLSWKEPWRFLSLLRRWLQLLARALLPANTPHEDPVEVLKEHQISLTIVVQHVEAQESLEREGYKEESFDYISQCLRTAVLPLSAALVYTSSSPPPQQPGASLSDVQKVLFTSLTLDLTPLSPAPAKGTTATKREDLTPKHNVVDRMAIVVPSGWDSAGKIRLLSENFSPEALLEAWTTDLNTPPQPPQQQQQQAPTSPALDTEANQAEQQASGGASPPAERTILSTSDADSDPDLPSPPHQPPSAITTYETQVEDPTAHKAPKPPQIEVTTKPNQTFLTEMRRHLQDLETQDQERAKNNPNMVNTTAGSLSAGRSIGLPTGEQTGALHELGDVSFNVGGVNYNTVSAEAAIERLKRPAQPSSGSMGGGAEAGSSAAQSPRISTPRPPRRDDREASGTPQPPPSTGSSSSRGGDLPADKLEEYFASLMKKAGGGGASAAGSREGTPSRH